MMLCPTKSAAFLMAILASTFMAKAQVEVPPPGLYCCPKKGPNHMRLTERQIGPFFIYCIYGEGEGSVGCFYDPGSGIGATIPGCPSQAPKNRHPPKCPI